MYNITLHNNMRINIGKYVLFNKRSLLAIEQTINYLKCITRCKKKNKNVLNVLSLTLISYLSLKQYCYKHDTIFFFNFL